MSIYLWLKCNDLFGLLSEIQILFNDVLPSSILHPDFHWPNILATDFHKFHWWLRKYDKLIASFTDQEVN